MTSSFRGIGSYPKLYRMRGLRESKDESEDGVETEKDEHPGNGK